MEASQYWAPATLRNGRQIEIRSLRPEDRDAMLAAVEQTSPQSIYRRFFAPKRHFSEPEVSYFLNIDFRKHVALVAVARENDRELIVGGGRYVVLNPAQAEVAFAVVDRYQGQGIGAALMRHLTAIAREGGIREFVAEVLPENLPMQKVFEKSGLDITKRNASGTVHIVLQL